MSCIKKCFGVNPGSDTAEAIDNAWEWIVHNASEYIKQQAAAQGVKMPEGVEDKLYRVGVKSGVAPLREVDLEHYANKMVD